MTQPLGSLSSISSQSEEMIYLPWQEVFLHLEKYNLIHATEVCHTFENLPLNVYHSQLEDKISMNAKQLLDLHLPLFHLLVFDNPQFAKQKDQFQYLGEELHQTWREYSLPLIIRYALSKCRTLEELDLSHPRYSVNTFLGQFDNFQEEIATITWEPGLQISTYPQIQTVSASLEPYFNEHLPMNLTLPHMKKLTVVYPYNWNDWSEVKSLFPNLEIIELTSNELSIQYSEEQIAALIELFPKVKEIVRKN